MLNCAHSLAALDSRLRELGGTLNLKPHYVVSSLGVRTQVYTCGDLEARDLPAAWSRIGTDFRAAQGHRGLDGRLYVVDSHVS